MNTQIDSFAKFELPLPMLKTLHQIGYEKPSPIQAASIPIALEGKDILGIAQTGTGKTGAFGIPLLNFLYSNPNKVGLILAPTRELAAQIGKVLRQFGKKLKMQGTVIVGGESFGRQVRELEREPDYIVATPGRLNDHLREGTVRLDHVACFVLDEMDRMLDMGFAPQIKQITRRLPRKRQTLLFSATLPSDTSKIAHSMLHAPVKIDIAPKKEAVSIKETTVKTTQVEKSRLIEDVLKKQSGKTLVFVRTKSRTEKLARLLGKGGHKVVNLHGGRTQKQRKRALDMFRKGSHPIMVATDVAGRGIDVTDIECVINYDVPQCREDYIHRIGRTGRYGRKGVAINFVTAEDRDAKAILTGKSTKGKAPHQPQRKKPARPKRKKKRHSFRRKRSRSR